MFYIMFGIAALVGLYGLYRFFLAADVKQIKAFLLTAGFIVIAGVLLLLAVTGRLPAAIALLFALLPLAAGIRRRIASPSTHDAPPPPASQQAAMDREEALAVLGLAEGATDEDIKTAHKKLIKKTHPDAEGSEWLAARINQARDILLRQ